MSSDVILTHEFSKHYGSTIALDKVTFKAPRRSVGLLGPNGAGKTTMIRALLGIIRPTGGTASILGLDTATSIQEIRDKVGYSPEFAPSIPHISAQKYVMYMGRLSGLSPVEAAQRAHDTLHYVGLGEERYRHLREFSHGMMQKAKLAAALVHDPELVILDEPTDGLDPEGRQQMLDLIERLYKDEGKTLLVSSHLLFDVEKVCDWVVVLGRGRIVASGDMAELLEERSGDIRVRLAGDSQRLVDRLKARGLRIDFDGINIDVERVDGVEMIILEETHSDPEISLRYMGRKTRTLEDVFISLVEGGGEVE